MTDSWGLPDRAYVSIRVGGTRLQRPFKKNEIFYFPSTHHSALKVDVFEYLGSAQLPLFSLKPQAVEGASDASDVKLGENPNTRVPMGLKMKCVAIDP